MAQAKTELEPQERAQTAELRVIFETLPLGVACLKDRRVQSANFAFDQMFGYARGATAGLDMLTFYAHAEDHERIGREGYAALARGEDYRAEAQLRRADGSLFAGSLTGRAVAPQNPAAGSIWQVEDITERKQAEVTMRANQLTAERYLNIAAEIIMALDAQGNITLLNDSGHRLLGYASGELQGKNWFTTCLAEADRAQIQRFFEQLRTGAASTVENHENSVLTRSGERRVIAWHNATLREEDGRFAGTLSSGEDITERRRAEAALRLKNFVFDESLAANSIADLRGVMTETNAAFLRCWGYPRKEEVIGQPIPHFLADPVQAAAIVAALGQAGQWEGEYTAKRKDGSTFIAHSQATAVRDEAGRVIGYQSSVIDVTERRRAEASLQAAYTKLELLWGVASLAEAEIKTISDHILVGITRISASQYGFYGFVNEDESVMTIHSWSGDAMQDCTMVSKPTDFSVCQAGVWAEAIRRRAPLILNDYGATHAGKHGLPEGHVALTNLLVVPHFCCGRITAVAAVANRAADYGPDDVRQIQTFMGSAQAVVERRRAEEALRKSQSMLAQTEKVGTVGGWEFDIETGKQTWTETMYDIHELDHSYQPTEARGLDFYAPVSRPIIEQAVRRTVEQGVPFDLELEIITAKGNRRSVHAIGKAAPAGRRVFGFFQDITERKLAEEALRESELQFKALADTSPLAIYLSAGLEQRAKYLNPTFVRLFGYTLEEVPTVAQWWPLAYPEATYRRQIEAEWQRKVQQAIATHTEIEPMEVVVTCKDGSHKIIQWGFRVIGQQNWAFGLDLTERKRAEAQLRELLAQTQQDARTKAELLKEVNHRVKNNLLAILGLAAAEQRQLCAAEKPAALRFTSNLRRRIKGLLTVHQMLSASKWAPVPVNQLARKIIQSALTAAPAGCPVKVDLQPSAVQVSPRQASNLALVFNELATNTVKHALANRTAACVTFAATSTESRIRLEYRDDGPGYPSAVLRQEHLSVGMILVRDLTTQTLRGQLTLANDHGAVTVLEIKTEEVDRT